MLRLIRKYAQICIILLGSVAGYGQNVGSITGKVADKATGQPIEFAAVVISGQKTNSIVTGGTTDSAGRFIVTNVPVGNYCITIEFIGYKSDTLNSVGLSDVTRNINLGTVLLTSLQHSLKGVTVTAAIPLVENKIDKIVYNAANDVTAQGGVALDVLKKVPQVGVDVDGNVDIQGNSNIRFLINGKPSSIFNSPVDALSSIPASQIKSIEVITSPGAKYDAEGTGGIINIILKDNKLQGINGNITLSAGTRLENTSVNLNMKRGNFGMNAFFSGNAQLLSRTPNSQNRSSADTLHLNQNGYTDFQRQGYQSGIGFDWNISKHNDLSGSAGYNYLANKNVNFYTQEQYTLLPDTSKSQRNSKSRFANNTIELALAYKKTFKKEGQELDVLYNSSFGRPVNDYIQTLGYYSNGVAYDGSQSHNPGTDNETDLAIDYTQPVTKNVVLEGGAKGILQHIQSAAAVGILNTADGTYPYDPTQSYTLNYDRKIYAGYVSGSFSFGSFEARVGLRIEHTDTKIDLGNTNIPSYNSFVPSITVLRKLKNDQSIKLSYSHRIERPDFRELNPFVNRSDPYNITTGNPLLTPEIGDNIELGYSKTFGKSGNVYVSLYERMDHDDLKPVTTFYASYNVGDSVYSNVSVANMQNIGREYNTGVSIFGASTLTDQLSIRGNVQAGERRVISYLAANGIAIGYRFRVNLTASYQFQHNLIAEAFGNYNSASQLLQGRIPQSLTYTFACRKQFWKKNASIGLTATNIFSKYIDQVTTVVTDNYVSYNVRELPYRSVGISFTYKFGKLEIKKGKEDSYLNNPPDAGG